MPNEEPKLVEPKYRVTKTYGHECGLSAVFRQWHALSHCQFMHGYALAFTLTFECVESDLDENGWVINFGGLKKVKQYLEETFDHKVLVAKDDPAITLFRDMNSVFVNTITQTEQKPRLIQLVEVERTGCEAFAKMVYGKIWCMLADGQLGMTRAEIVSVEVREHGGNSATYLG